MSRLSPGGGIGRRAWFRSKCPYGHRSSSLLSGKIKSLHYKDLIPLKTSVSANKIYALNQLAAV